jgi:hemerythrin-like domain-containing protein
MQSRAITFDLAYHNGKELVELIKLHVFREDNTLFPLAQKLFTEEELENIFQEIESIHA